MELVENPPSTASAFRDEVVLVVTDVDNRINELSDCMSLSSRNGHETLLVAVYTVIPVSDVHLSSVAVSGFLRSEQFARIHVDADSR